MDNVIKLNQDHYKKILFIIEQLRLVLMDEPRKWRYSADLLAMACTWSSVSPDLYRQIISDGVLTLPCTKYVRRISNGIEVESSFTISDSTVAYLESRKKKLAKNDLPVSLLMDKVYVQKSVQYRNGKFHGLDDSGKAVKPLFCVMIKSIAGNYRDIIAMSPIVNINADILYKIWLNVLKVVSNLGFNVTDTMTDGHS